jgi:hypothetical protein
MARESTGKEIKPIEGSNGDGATEAVEEKRWFSG